jgi:hypothetical protein
MADEWMIRGVEFANCICNWGCPCQFGAPSTHGRCEAVVSGHIDEGHFNSTSLDGLNWVLLLSWPGEIAAGDGRQQAIIDERADPDQRDALNKILHGESTSGTTHFVIYSTTMSSVLETLYAPIDISIDVDGRMADVKIQDLVEAKGRPIVSTFTGKPVRSRIDLPGGFEFTIAEMGNGNSTVRAGIELDFNDSYGQFNVLHMNQDGVIR